MELRRVAVTGLGALTPLGNDVQSFWANLVQGQSGAAPITRFDAANFKTQFACEVKDFDPSEWIHRKDSRKMDLFTQYAVVTAEMALKDAGLSAEEGGNLDPDRAGHGRSDSHTRRDGHTGGHT